MENQTTISIENILPRLKKGHVENPGKIMITGMIQGKEQEFEMPFENYLLGKDIGEDYACCFAIDNGATFQFLKNKDLDSLGITKDELFELAKNNFINKFGSSIKSVETNWPSVTMLTIDQNNEAGISLIPALLEHIRINLKFNRINFVIPSSTLFLCWDEIEPEEFNTFIKQVVEIKNQEPGSKQISNWTHSLIDGIVVKGTKFD